MSPPRRLLMSLALVLIGACGPRDQRTDTLDAEGYQSALTPEYVQHMELGNSALRAGDLNEAARHFEAIVQGDSSATAAWFGIYMVERARGDLEAAARALEWARRSAPGATLLSNDPRDTIR